MSDLDHLDFELDPEALRGLESCLLSDLLVEAGIPAVTHSAIWHRFGSIEELVSVTALELHMTTGVGLWSVGRIQRTLAKRGAFLAGDEPRVGRTGDGDAANST